MLSKICSKIHLQIDLRWVNYSYVNNVFSGTLRVLQTITNTFKNYSKLFKKSWLLVLPYMWINLTVILSNTFTRARFTHGKKRKKKQTNTITSSRFHVHVQFSSTSPIVFTYKLEKRIQAHGNDAIKRSKCRTNRRRQTNNKTARHSPACIHHHNSWRWATFLL